MAKDINEEVSNAYNAAKQALNDDLKQNLYNATQARMTAYRQINNNANARHALFSGVPMGEQMQYDAQTYIPNIATMATKAMTKQEENQEKWDKYMEYIKKLQEQADYYNKKASSIRNQIPKGTSGGGFSFKPTDPSWPTYDTDSSSNTAPSKPVIPDTSPNADALTEFKLGQ